MEPRVREWTRPWAGPLAVVVGLTLVGSPALAGALQAPAAPKSLRAAAASKVEALGTDSAVSLSQDPGAGASSSESGKSFFKSKKGAAALILVAGAFTWALVSRSKDAIHSPAK